MPQGKKSKPKRAKGLSKEVRDIFARFGSEGGKIGGKLRWEGVTPEEHSAIAKKAAEARWKKAKPKPDKP